MQALFGIVIITCLWNPSLIVHKQENMLFKAFFCSVWPRATAYGLDAQKRISLLEYFQWKGQFMQNKMMTLLSVSQSQTANFTNKRNQKIRKSIHDRYTVIPVQQQCSLLKLLFGKRVLRFKFLLDRYLRYSCM